jgi:hypothetical protein
MSEHRLIALFDSDGVPAQDSAPQIGDCPTSPLGRGRGAANARCSSRALNAGSVTHANPTGYPSAVFEDAVEAAVRGQSLCNVKDLVAGGRAHGQEVS